MISERKQWFLDRVGKTVYRNDNGCPCDVCKRVLEEGLIIGGDFHAEYLYDMEGDCSADGGSLRYFDTRSEAQSFDNLVKATKNA